MGFSNYSVFLLKDGTVKAVGENFFEQLGTSTNPLLSLYTMYGLNNIKQIACEDHIVFLMNDGTIKTRGNNDNGQCGTGNTITPQLSLYTIKNLTNVKQVALGIKYTVFLLNDGTVKTVGYNYYGQCGTGDTYNKLSLYTIPNLNNVKQIACGSDHTVFLLNDGTVKTVGYNNYGQCGTGNKTSPQLSLYTIPDLNNVKQIACGYSHTVFLMNDGTVKTLGHNSFGQCGTGNTTTPQLSLYTIPGLNNVKQVACGTYYTVFLLNDGTVKTVGYNANGQCGTGNTITPQLSLYTIPGLNNVKQISCGAYHTVFLLEDGTVKTVGNNGNGQCGTDNKTSSQLTLYTIYNLNNVDLLFNNIPVNIKYLILQNSKYYSINGAYYNTITKLYNSLPILEGSIPTASDIDQYGFGIKDLNIFNTINEETFKPINKFNDNFELKRYKEI